MAKLAAVHVAQPRICEFARRLYELHQLGGEDAIDEEFAAVCRAIWGFTLDDFADDDLSPEDHAWLDRLTQECAIEFAAEQICATRLARTRGTIRVRLTASRFGLFRGALAAVRLSITGGDHAVVT
jgi:hypothetical protein